MKELLYGAAPLATSRIVRPVVHRSHEMAYPFPLNGRVLLVTVLLNNYD